MPRLTAWQPRIRGLSSSTTTLFPGAQLEVVVQAAGAAVEIAAFMPRRVEVLNPEGRMLSRHGPRAHRSFGRGRSGWGVEGGSEHPGVLGRECVPGLQVEDTRGLALDGGTQERGLVDRQRERGMLDQAASRSSWRTRVDLVCLSDMPASLRHDSMSCELPCVPSPRRRHRTIPARCREALMQFRPGADTLTGNMGV